MAKTIRQSVEFEGVSADELYETYTTAELHAAAIGAPADITDEAGASFSAFESGGVRGTNLFAMPGRLVVQSWRAQPWEADDPDSTLVLAFTDTASGARIDLVQTMVPDQAYEIIDGGWHQMYWEPWRKHLQKTEV